MEIGSFIELQMPKGLEYYKGDSIDNMEIIRLNTGRAAIYHAFIATRCKAIWLPYYQCETVKEFLERKGVACKFYHINSSFNPLPFDAKEDEAVLLVNYYGIMSFDRMSELALKYENVIIDNSQAFFSKPICGCISVYSARKFIGVPDGAYVIGENVFYGFDKYDQGYSSDTALFMLQRIEYGCEGKAYSSRTENENRIDTEDCKKMSPLTRYILDGTDYDFIKKKRTENFLCACDMFNTINQINPEMYYNESCIPMIYPLLVEDDNLLEKLLKAKHFQGHWWNWVWESPISNEFEKWISRYMIPITIDQRYDSTALQYIRDNIV